VYFQHALSSPESSQNPSTLNRINHIALWHAACPYIWQLTGGNDALVTFGQRPPQFVKTVGLRDNPAKASTKKAKVTQQQGRFK